MHSQMTYPELVAFIEKRLTEQGSQAMLTKQELINYRASICQDPLLEALLIWYLPYQKRWERAVWRSVHAHGIQQEDNNLQIDVHDPALSGPRMIAKNWLQESYPHHIAFSADKTREAKKILSEIGDAIQSGQYDNILLAQEHERQIQLEKDRAKKQGRKYDKDKVKKGASIESIKEEFKTYINHFITQLSNQTASVDEILCLKVWIDAAPGEESSEDIPLKKKADRVSVIIESLDESRTAYFAGGEFAGKVYSCPLGAEERFLDRVALIMSAEKGEVFQTQEQILIQNLIGPFIQKDPENQNLMPTNHLYQTYLQAIGCTLDYEKQTHFSLKFDSESQEYNQSLTQYVGSEKRLIEDAFKEYLDLIEQRNQGQKNLGIKINKCRATIAPYLKIQSDNQSLNNSIDELLDDCDLRSLIEQKFHKKIAQVIATPLQDMGPGARLFASELFEEIQREVLVIKKDDVFGSDSANQTITKTPSDAEVIEKMGKIIGFGPEHIELLLSIIGQSHVVKDNNTQYRLGGLELLESYYNDELAVLEYDPKSPTQQEHNKWLEETSTEYLAYIEAFPTRYIDRQPFITMLPHNFDDHQTIEDIQKRFDSKENWPCSVFLMNRLFKERKLKINIDLLNKKQIYATPEILLFCAANMPILLGDQSDIYEKVALFGYCETMSFLLAGTRRDKQKILNDCVKLSSISLEMFMLLLNEGAEVPQHILTTYLEKAIEENDFDLFQYLLKKYYSEADMSNVMNMLQSNGMTYLMLAVRNRAHAIVDFLLSHGADMSICVEGNDFPEGTDVLKIAVSLGDIQSVSRLLAPDNLGYSQTLNSQDIHGVTALIKAVRGDYEEIVKELLNKGARADIELYDTPFVAEEKPTPKTALQIAVNQGSLPTVQLLLQDPTGKESLNSKSGSMTALDFAIENDYREIAIFLKENGAEYDPLNTLHQASYLGDADALQNILANAASFAHAINDTDSHGFTCLMLAAQTGCLKSVETLLEMGADPSILITRAVSSVDLYNPFVEINNKKSVLHLIVVNNNLEILKLILKNTPESKKQQLLDQQDSSGYTALMVAIQKGHKELVREFLAQGASLLPRLTIKSDPFLEEEIEEKNDNALEMALRQRDTEIIEMLLDSPAVDELLRDPTFCRGIYNFSVKHNNPPYITEKISEKAKELQRYNQELRSQATIYSNPDRGNKLDESSAPNQAKSQR